jgi:hypothetical protein
VTSATVNNSYALGHIIVDKTVGTGTVYAGGLLGQLYLSGASVGYCFAAGSVTVQSAGTNTNRAGGLVGGVVTATNKIEHSAALGPSVTVAGPGTKNQGRVYGYAIAGATHSDNYALDTMRLETSNAYGTYYFPSTADANGSVWNYSSTGAHDNEDGANAAASGFRNAGFWSSTAGLGFNSAASYTGTAPWDLGSVLGRGYPTLVGVGGAQ